MNEKDPRSVIESYKKKRQAAQRAPLIVLLVAGLLLVIGAAIVIFWVLNPDKSVLSMFATATPTPTNTFTPTATSTATATPTITPSPTNTEVPPTITLTPTISGPFIYRVEDGDTCWGIAQKFGIDLVLLITINNLDPSCVINPGQNLTIPGKDTQLPTATPIPTGLARGQKIEYVVQVGDTLGAIALLFNSTVEAIREENELADDDEITPGQVLIVPVNLVTPVPTNTPIPPTETPGPGTPTAVVGTPVNVTPESPTPTP